MKIIALLSGLLFAAGAYAQQSYPTIGQVVLKRLISAEQVLEILQNAEELLRK